MAHAKPTTVLSHWNHIVPGLNQSSKEFYDSVERTLGTYQLQATKVERVNLSEGGIFSSKREYLQIKRSEHVFHVCAAPFGTGFFISWWLGHVESGWRAWIATWPVFGWIMEHFIKPLTYYKVDTALMFQSATHGAVMEALDGLTNAKGLRALSETERKPVMRDFFAQISG